MADFDLSGYNTVAERIAEFREKHPDGVLRPMDPERPFTVVEVGGQSFVAFTAAAYRTPDDLFPGVGTAWEPVPGPTKFTRNSELQNAETAAWGRAIIAVGAADAKKGVASREDVVSRAAEQEWYDSPEYQAEQAVPGLRTAIEGAIGKLSDDQRDELKAWFAAENLPAVRRMNAAQCDRVLDHLMALPEVAEGTGSQPPGQAVGAAMPVPSDEPTLDLDGAA